MEKKSRYISAAALFIIFGIFLIINICAPKEYPKTMHVAVNACKVRNGAGVEFELVGKLRQGEIVIVLDVAEDQNNQTWYKIDSKSLPKDERSWISAEEYYVRSDLLMQNNTDRK